VCEFGIWFAVVQLLVRARSLAIAGDPLMVPRSLVLPPRPPPVLPPTEPPALPPPVPVPPAGAPPALLPPLPLPLMPPALAPAVTPLPLMPALALTPATPVPPTPIEPPAPPFVAELPPDWLLPAADEPPLGQRPPLTSPSVPAVHALSAPSTDRTAQAHRTPVFTERGFAIV